MLFGFTGCEGCLLSCIASIKLLNLLGIIIDPDKSIFLPKQEITFLGFNVNSQKMEITFTDTKKETFKLAAANCSIRIIKLLDMLQK